MVCVLVYAYALGTSACSAAELMPNTRREMILFICERFRICLHRPDALVKTLTKTFKSVKPYPPSAHICASESGQYCSDNGLSPIRHQVIT